MRARSAESRVSWSPAVERVDWGSLISSGIDSTVIRSPAGEDGHSLDDVPQLTDVAGPAVTLEDLHDIRIDLPAPEVVAGAELGEEVRGELADVLRALAKRGHPDGHDAQAIVEVFPEPARRDQLVEATVGGGDDARGDANGLLASHTLKLTVLQDAKQLRLRRLVQVAHLVEEDGAAVGQLEQQTP